MVSLMKAADKTQNEEEPSKPKVWLPFLYMLIEKQP